MGVVELGATLLLVLPQRPAAALAARPAPGVGGRNTPLGRRGAGLGDGAPGLFSWTRYDSLRAREVAFQPSCLPP